MVDPVGSVKQVLQVALKIKEAVDTVRSNKEVCHQIRGRVNRLRAILSKLEDADAVDDPATADTLKDLEETLHRAYSLVAACQEDRNMVSLLFSAGKLSRNLRQVNEDILAQMAIASFGNNVRTTIMLTKHFQDSLKGDAEHGMRLPWPVRFQIIEGIAQGLLYLHQQCGLRIVHMDIKPNNILLDDDYIPKITDFGISEVLFALAHEEETGVVRGTPGFVDPELVTNCRFSAKTDVYGYGVLLLETISGKSCIQADSDFNILSAWVSAQLLNISFFRNSKLHKTPGIYWHKPHKSVGV
uniref:Uncharacterized protein n=1 Tax=Avena sativa TaxID=4498 RepID=A0ACD5WLE8_AVESA